MNWSIVSLTARVRTVRSFHLDQVVSETSLPVHRTILWLCCSCRGLSCRGGGSFGCGGWRGRWRRDTGLGKNDYQGQGEKIHVGHHSGGKVFLCEKVMVRSENLPQVRNTFSCWAIAMWLSDCPTCFLFEFFKEQMCVCILWNELIFSSILDYVSVYERI